MAQSPHIIFIHGLSNKPPLIDLQRIWLEALAEDRSQNQGFDLGAKGVKSSFIYWANLFYDKPLSVTDYESRSDELEASVKNDIELSSDVWMKEFLKNFPLDEENIFVDAPVSEEDSGYERIPIPWVLKKQVIKHFAQEAHDYFFNVNGIKDKIRIMVVDAIKKSKTNGENAILVGHSLGAVIAYDVLSGDIRCPEIDGLMTIGSPLGIDEVQDKLTWTRENGFPEKLKGKWVNVYDPFDAIARLDPKHASDFKQNGNEIVIDINESNWGAWRHSATKYLKGSVLRDQLRELAGRS